MQPNYRTEHSQIAEQNTAKLPNKTQPNCRTEYSQIAELEIKFLNFMFEFQIFIVFLRRDKI